MKIVTVIGARPQFVKAAPVQRAMLERGGIDHVLVHTGQHFDSEMSDVFFEQLGLAQPDHHLGIHAPLHGQMTGRMLEAVEAVLLEEDPDWVLVYGDTNSTAAAALAAAKLPIRLAHVEAGLRSYNRSMPEEINRVVADHLSDLCFAPTDAAVSNLEAEGIRGSTVVRTGDVMFDAVQLFASAATDVGHLVRVDAGRPLVLATIHRAENTDDTRRLTAIVNALESVAETANVVLPIHPRTQGALKGAGLAFERVHVLPPVGYLEMLALEARADLVVTDSGGVQKEAFFQRTPCVTLRSETEWVELLELGWNRLADPSSPDAVAGAVRAALAAGEGADAHPYGDGRAADKIVAALLGG